VKRLLLHACCAPDATVPLEDLEAEGYAVTLYWYGANIHPQGEEVKRREAMLRLAGGRTVITGDESVAAWMEAASPLASEPEGGRRCGLCFRRQLEGAARAAKEEGIGLLCTTLTISPHKKADFINTIGSEAAEKYGLKWLDRVFRKKGGFQRSVALSRELELYRQSYCGCVFSLRRGEIND
jgi:predicted adenine nucleotide alpha hydrolase (AANH) superfamily ATPase